MNHNTPKKIGFLAILEPPDESPYRCPYNLYGYCTNPSKSVGLTSLKCSRKIPDECPLDLVVDEKFASELAKIVERSQPQLRKPETIEK